MDADNLASVSRSGTFLDPRTGKKQIAALRLQHVVGQLAWFARGVAELTLDREWRRNPGPPQIACFCPSREILEFQVTSSHANEPFELHSVELTRNLSQHCPSLEELGLAGFKPNMDELNQKLSEALLSSQAR